MTNTDIGPRPEEPYGIGQGQDSEAQFVRILEWEEARADKAEAEVAALREMWQAKEGQLDIKDDYIGELQGQIATMRGMLEYLLAQLEGSDALSNGEIIDIKKALEDGR